MALKMQWYHILKLYKNYISKITNIWIFSICLCTSCMLLHTVHGKTCWFVHHKSVKILSYLCEGFSIPLHKTDVRKSVSLLNRAHVLENCLSKVSLKVYIPPYVYGIYIKTIFYNPNDYMQLSWEKEFN